MRRTRTLLSSLVLVVLLFLAHTRDAHAYIDPGSGSYIVQLIIAGLLGAAFAARIYWKRIKEFFSPGQEKEDGSE